MTRWWIIPAILLALAVGGAIGVAASNHDDDRGERLLQITTQPVEPGQAPQVVTIDDGGDHWRGGFFPFGFIFPLLWIGLIILFISWFWRGGRGRGGPGRWEGRFEEWHRRQHETGDNESPPAGAGRA